MMTSEEILKTEYSQKFDEIRKSLKEFRYIFQMVLSDFFDELRKKAMVNSFYKYGPLKVNYGQKYVDNIKSLERRIEKYTDTGNTEYMADVANFAMIEFMCPQNPKANCAPMELTCTYLGVDNVFDIRRCLEGYASTGNTYLLAYLANFAMTEFCAPRHAMGHYRATASEKESPGLHGMSVNECKTFTDHECKD